MSKEIQAYKIIFEHIFSTLILVLAVVFGFFLKNNLQQKSIYMRSQQVMGTIATFHGETNSNPEDISNNFFRIMVNIDSILSTYKPESQVSIFNKNGDFKNPHNYFLKALNISHKIYDETFGYFNVMIGQITMEHYGFKNINYVPMSELDMTNQTYEQLVPAMGNFHKIQYNTNFVKKEKSAAFHLDFGGMGKGLALDIARNELKLKKSLKGSISLSGDIRCFKSCVVYIDNPFDHSKPLLKLKVKGDDIGISTSSYTGRYSGSSENHHLIDPYKIKSFSQLNSLTLIGSYDSAFLDGWTTGISIMPLELMYEFFKKYSDLGYVIYTKNNRLIYKFPSNIEVLP